MAKRGRKPKTERTGYFYEREEEAFVKYITTEDPIEKEKIFKEFLHKPFCRMIESIIRRYKLLAPDEEFEDIFNDTMSFLMTKVEKFNVNSGFKAYSYCGTICKNYLILKLNQYSKKQERNESYDVMPFIINNSTRYSYEIESDDVEILNNIIKTMSKEVTKMLDDKEKYKLNAPLYIMDGIEVSPTTVYDVERGIGIGL